MTKFVRSLRSGQITIPAEFRQKLGITPDKLLQLTLDDGELRIKLVRVTNAVDGSPWLKELYDLFSPVRKEAKKTSEKEVSSVIDKAVKAVRHKND